MAPPKPSLRERQNRWQKEKVSLAILKDLWLDAGREPPWGQKD